MRLFVTIFIALLTGCESELTPTVSFDRAVLNEADCKAKGDSPGCQEFLLSLELARAMAVERVTPMLVQANATATIAGKNFADEMTLVIDGQQVGLTFVSETELTFVVPAVLAAGGTRSVVGTVSNGVSAASFSFYLTDDS